MEFNKNGQSIFLQKKDEESDDIFYEKGWFIISQDLKKYKNLNKLIVYAKIWINMKYRKCKYSDNIEKKIKEMENNYKKNTK